MTPEHARYHNPANPNSAASRTERLTWAYGVLTNWWFENRHHHLALLVSIKCGEIADLVDRELGAHTLQYSSRGRE